MQNDREKFKENFNKRLIAFSIETKYWLLILKERKSGFSEKIDTFYKEVEEISNTFGSNILTLKNKN